MQAALRLVDDIIKIIFERDAGHGPANKIPSLSVAQAEWLVEPTGTHCATAKPYVVGFAVARDASGSLAWRFMSSPSDYLTSLYGLSGKVAVVVGGTGELCGVMAEGMAAAGAEVVVVGRNEEKAQPRLARMKAGGGTAYFVSSEASEKAQVQQLLETVLKRSGRVDILVNGAGVNSATPFLEIAEDEFDRILRINVKGVFLGCQIFGKYLVDRGEGGSIINLGSMSGIVPLSRVFTYSASKAAVHNLSKNLAREWAPKRVRVNTLVPGFFPAEQNRKILSPDRVASILGHTPMKRFGEARELVGATLLLASDAAGGFITGSEIVVDGGYHAMTI
jgi:NAD(P)-dependent dehydrogenase (short-subunit alcohol dehydrogenase family)